MAAAVGSSGETGSAVGCGVAGSAVGWVTGETRSLVWQGQRWVRVSGVAGSAVG